MVTLLSQEHTVFVNAWHSVLPIKYLKERKKTNFKLKQSRMKSKRNNLQNLQSKTITNEIESN